MRISVCVKEVPGKYALKAFDPESFHLIRDDPTSINEADKHALEEARRLREAGGVSEVMVVTVAPLGAIESVRGALAMGADRAVLVADCRIRGSDLVATSRVLARVLSRENSDLVLFGQEASDSNGALLWAAVADRLRLPVISKAVRLDIADGIARVRQQTEYGSNLLETPLPSLIAVSSSINEPRWPILREMKAAELKPIEVLSLSDLLVAPEDVGETGSQTKVLAAGDPPARDPAQMIEGERCAEEIVAYLVGRKLA